MTPGPGETFCAASHAQPDADALAAQTQMRRIAHKLLVLSGKGGVGKSTVAVNLAAALAKMGKKVGLLDIDVHGPSVPKMLHMEDQKAQIRDGRIMPIRTQDGLLVMSIGFLLPRTDEPVIWRGPMKHGVIRDFLGKVDWGRLDYLIVDAPPGTGDEALSIAKLTGPDSKALIVTTPQQVAVSDVRRCVGFCRRLSVDIIGIVENMSGWVCPKCGFETDLFETGGGEGLSAETGIPLLGKVPVDPCIVASGEAGVPLLDYEVQCRASGALHHVLQRIASSVQ